MGAGWVAGSVRARLLARHRLGPDGARTVAREASLPAALARMARSPYGDALRGASDAGDARHRVWGSALWELRVLAGWLPPSGVHALRVFAAFFEIENVEDLLAWEPGAPRDPYRLGALATAWPRLADAASRGAVREVCARSPWRDPGSDDPDAIVAHLRVVWARRLAELAPETEPWGAGAAALVLARRLDELGPPVAPALVREAAVIDRRSASALDVRAFVASLPPAARWPFDGRTGAAELWRAEAHWWRRLRQDGDHLLRGARPGPAIVLGAAASVLADAWETSAALELATRGADPELLDVIA